MRILIVENYRNTPLGQMEVAMVEAGAEQVVVKAWAGEPLPAMHEGFDAMVALGGEQNALDDANYPYFPALLELIRGFEAADKSVLGICLGSQQIARAFGGTNIIGGVKEFGWHHVGLTEKGAQDPLFDGIAQSFPIFEWHSDHFTLPPDAVRLAGTGIAENQCFRIGRACYATQFHFEASTTVVEGWNEAFVDSINRMDATWLANYPATKAQHGALADGAGLRIARQWMKTIG